MAMSSSSTFSSDAARSAHFAWKLLLLASPFVAWLGFPVLVLWASGELTVSIDSVIARQQSSAKQVLFGPAYSNPVKMLKLRATQRRAPRILALGTSIIMEFRAGFFREPEAFYNAGGGIVFLWELEELLKEIPPEHSPKVLLLGLDQCQFNRVWHQPYFESRRSPYHDYQDPNPLRVIQDNWLEVYKGYRAGKFSLACLASRRSVAAVGLRALAEGGGFRNDGSHCLGTIKDEGAAHPACWDYHFAKTLERVDNNGERFQYGETVAPERVAILDSFLEECHRRKIHVVAFLPPLAPTVWKRMTARGPKCYGYIARILPEVGPLFTRRGYTLVDHSDAAAALGASDAEFLDGYHPSEKVNLRMQLALAEADPVYRRLVDTDALRRLLRHSKCPCSVFAD
jgi:hypothetical protein